MQDRPLSSTDIHSAPIQKLKKFYEAKLEKLRKQNDDIALEKTERQRGRIHEVKYLLALFEEQKQIATELADADL